MIGTHKQKNENVLLKQSNLPLGELSFGVAEETAFNV
jgi:hypothetical protein